MNNGFENKLLSPGQAQFEIIQAWDKDNEGKRLVSKAGNPMFRLKLLVTDENGDKAEVWDYILLNNLKKLISLLMSIGKIEWQERVVQNTLNAESLVGQKGRCTIKTDIHEIYGTKTVIEWYLRLRVSMKDAILVQQTDTFKINPTSINTAEDYPF